MRKKNFFWTRLFYIALILLTSSLQSACLEGDCQNGEGRAIYEGGDIYSGAWKEGRAHGRGTLYYARGGVYTGNWENGMANGFGVFLFPNGDRYVGNWKDSKAHGIGSLYKFDGSLLFEGEWMEGKQIEKKTGESNENKPE
jgi:hypothetical protein